MITTPITLPNGEESYKLLADDGKVIVRISDGQIFGTSLDLGYTYYIGGQLQDPPHKETPEEYTEATPPRVPTPSEDDATDPSFPVSDQEPSLVPPPYGTVPSILAAIDRYDTSQNVNVFYLNGQPMWIDKATRVGIVNAINATKAAGDAQVTLGIGGLSLTVDCNIALQMMYAIERYALACYNVTLAHKNAVMQLSDADAQHYDYTAGYPDKLHLYTP